MTRITGSVAFKFAATTMVVALLGVGLLAWLSYKEADRIFREQSAVTLASNSRMYSQTVSKRIGSLKYDLTMLSLDDSIKGLVRALHDPDLYDETTNKTADQFKQEIADLFVVMAEQNPPYFQIRIIDATDGMELVRVEKHEGRVRITPRKDLQDKSHRDYVRASMALGPGEIYLSPISLNREHHTIEVPYRPTIRVSKMLYYKGRKGLIIVINADVKKLFGFDRFKKEQDITTFVADENGYYLYNPEAPYKEFAFEFGHAYKVFDDFPIRSLYDQKKWRLAWYDGEEDKLYEAQKIALDAKRFIVVIKRADSVVFKNRSHDYIVKMIIYVALIAMLIAMVSAVAAKKATRPIVELTRFARRIADTQGREEASIDIRTGDEIEELSRSIKAMLIALLNSREEIEQFAQKLEEEVARKTTDLQRLNAELEKKVQEGIEELRKKDQALMQSSKLADMGEMIGAIAHQWRQPLNALALNIQMLEDLAEEGALDSETIREFIEKNMKTIRFMSKTIDDFRNFYREEKEKRPFDVSKAVEDTIGLQKAQLEARGVRLRTDLKRVEVVGFKNDFMQVVLNLLSNARDAVLERMRREPNFEGTVRVRVFRDGDEAVIEVADNGGGVPEAIMSRIFEPYFTTKEEGKGTGLGLHMAKRIIEEKMGGTLSVRNDADGAVFEIRLKANHGDSTQ